MFSLVLIDDEYWALRGIRDYIDWESYGFSNIHCFDSSTEALEYILTEKPDAVFTDIRMPPLTGLDIIERCRAEGLATRFVVVSAYAEFSYAKRALENGAYSYILKPLNRKELAEVAQRLSDLLRSDRVAKLSRNLRTLVLRTLSGRSQAAEDILRECGPAFGGNYRVCAGGAVPKDSPGIWISVYDDLVVGIVDGSFQEPPGQNMGISTLAGSSSEAYGKFREALVAYYSVLFYGKQGPAYYHSTGISMRDMAEITEAVQAKKYAQAKSRLHSILSWAKENTIMLDSFTLFYNNLILQTLTAHGEKDLMRDIRPFSDCFQLLGVLHDISTVGDCLQTLIDSLTGEESPSGENTSDMMRSVVRFVEENFTQNITLELLAQKYYISVSYLSRRFKNLTGENFSEFIIHKRIEQACSLLSTTGLSVAEIGSACGYPDCFYFSRIFKKTMGMPPSKYRELENSNEN